MGCSCFTLPASPYKILYFIIRRSHGRRQLADASCQTDSVDESVTLESSLNIHREDNPALKEHLPVDINAEVNPAWQAAVIQQQ